MWQVDSSLRAMVSFRNYNLLDNFSNLGTFDIVFCRNVLIYFDRETKRDVLERIARQMAPDGYLVLGAAETIVGITDKFEPVNGRQGLLSLKDESVAGPITGLGCRHSRMRLALPLTPRNLPRLHRLWF